MSKSCAKDVEAQQNIIGRSSSEDGLVSFNGSDDALDPLNWTLSRKFTQAAALSLSTFTVALSSALFSTGVSSFCAEFGLSHEIGTLGVTLYVLGFAAGPLFWAPYSELKGRWWPIAVGMMGFATFSLGVASGRDVQTVLICRFWCGIFGASPMTVVSGIFTDLFDNKSRGAATTVYSMTVLMGPTLAPSIGGFISESSLGWRWTAWLASIMGYTSLLLILFLLDETYAPSILTSKAARLRKQTGNWALHSEQEEIDVDFTQLLTVYFARPLYPLFTETLVLLISIYLAFVYGLVYLFLTAFPIVFQEIHGMSPGIGGLCYIGMVLGIIVGGLWLIVVAQPGYRRKLAAHDNKAEPEWRLPPAVFGAASFAGGILWFGWTGYREGIHWALPTAAGVPIGIGIMVIFQQLTNYLLDTYLPFAASVMAGSAIIRSICGATFPLFAKTMFDSLGVQWASTLLGGVAVLGIPMPLFFYYKGRGMRLKGRLGLQGTID